MSEKELKPVPSEGWAAMIRKVYEVDPLVRPKCDGQMSVIAFITGFQAADRAASFAAIFVMLTSITGRKYTFLVKGGTDSDLNVRDHRVARKSKFL